MTRRYDPFRRRYVDWRDDLEDYVNDHWQGWLIGLAAILLSAVTLLAALALVGLVTGRFDDRVCKPVEMSKESIVANQSVSDLLRLACIYAEQDREAFVAAYEGMEDDPACVEAKEFLERLRAYRRGRWGRTGRDLLNELGGRVEAPE